ncbi:MAG: hypothetical protein A2Y38_19955 [Spirochaetes bacterium GWB1_59_5]|nr:MAG: hypothetical protein A2Y38_19955 [Spirochaetes bacterium GWB1_59_5]
MKKKTTTQETTAKARTAELVDSLRAEHLSDYLAKRTQHFSFSDWLIEVAKDGHHEADEYLGMKQHRLASRCTEESSVNKVGPLTREDGPCNYSFPCAEYHGRCQASYDKMKDENVALEHRLQHMGMGTPKPTTPPAPGKTVNIWKAQPVTKAGSIESVTIKIHETIPEVVYSDLNEWRQVAKKEAVELCDALCSTLPQGVVDALLVELLDRKRSLFVVPMPMLEKAND